MKALRNEKGIALVTSLMLTMITLGIVMALLYMITAGTQLSGMQKKYATALDASYGGADLIAKDIIPFVISNLNLTSSGLSTALNNTYNVALLNNYNLNLTVTPTQAACLQAKIQTDNTQTPWPSGCNANRLPSENPDMTFQLPSQYGNSPYTIYSEIVSTRVGNSDMSGLNLIGYGVAETSNIVYPQSQPYFYKIEVQGQKAGDTSVSANLEVLYAY